MRLHAIVNDWETARIAVAGGASVVQLRLKGVSTPVRVGMGRRLRALPATLVINDDIDAALGAGADGVHLGPDDGSAERALAGGLLVGRSVSTPGEARLAAAEGAAYLGVGPIYETTSKADAGEPIGLEGLAEVCRAVALPVVAVGGITPDNALDCLRAGARGLAVMRAARHSALLLAAMAG
ncbi:MAG: thiamine phosphate synthase [Candidatus Dormibacteria bacterium]